MPNGASLSGFNCRSLALAASIGALSVAASASPAGASVTLGQLPPSTPASTCSNVKDDWVQPVVNSGNSYTVPAVGRITSWSTRTSGTPGQVWTMKVFRHVSGTTYKVVGHDGPRALTSSQLNTFTTSVAVSPGDLVGMNDNDTSTPASTACEFTSTGNTIFFGSGSLGDGQSGPIASAIANRFLNIQAVFEPSNSFTIGAVTRDRRRGTATVTVDLPNPGELTASGTGVNAATAGAVSSKSVPAGESQLFVRATGRKKRKLRRTGKVKLNVAISYTPTGGASRTKHAKLRLRRKSSGFRPPA